MARHEDDDEFFVTEFESAQQYIQKHPEFALCRVRHDISFHRPPVDIEYHADGDWTDIYICGGCASAYHRRYHADGRFRSGTWKYSEGYVAEKGTGYALISRSGRAAFNLARRDLMRDQPRNTRKTKRR